MGILDFLKKAELEKIATLEKQIISKDQEILELKNHLLLLNKYEGVLDADIEAQKILADAKNEAETILQDIQNKASENKKVIELATIQAGNIIRNAEKKAQEIAGDAYKAMKSAKNLENTIRSLRNVVKGYGDDYLVPTYSLLDQLADDFGYTEAGVELKNARERSRVMVRKGFAAECNYVENYRRTTAIKFTTDAFNGKVDSILSSIKHDNFGTLKQKIIDSYNLVNNLGDAFRNAVITPEYLEARLEELKWAVIVIELKNQEREEQRRIKDQIREEERARREFEKAIKDAEKEESVIKKALEKAQADLATASEEQRLKYEQKLAELTEKLRIAEEKGQRAISMAQQTKSGHVYVISNVGSFGENIYKIGMTRRLEPEDRVRELGDASVPFAFDIHAMIYSENAPALENTLHKHFLDCQVNKVNTRKEFFKVGIDNIKTCVESLNLKTRWTMVAMATEYRESQAIGKELEANAVKKGEWEQKQLSRLNTNYINDEAELDN